MYNLSRQKVKNKCFYLILFQSTFLLNYEFQVLEKVHAEFKEFKILNKLKLIQKNESKKSKSAEYWNFNLKNEFIIIDNETLIQSEDCVEIFENEWTKKRPLLIKNLHKNINMDLWSPESFMNDFGQTSVNLVDCKTDTVIMGYPMTIFWKGFENTKGK
jgi:hypothetical protein